MQNSQLQRITRITKLCNKVFYAVLLCHTYINNQYPAVYTCNMLPTPWRMLLNLLLVWGLVQLYFSPQNINFYVITSPGDDPINFPITRDRTLAICDDMS